MLFIFFLLTSTIIHAVLCRENSVLEHGENKFRSVEDAGNHVTVDGVKCDDTAKFAALWEAINNQQLEIVGLKLELTELKETVTDQETLIKSQKGENMSLKKRIQQQDRQMATVKEKIKELYMENAKTSDENGQTQKNINVRKTN